MTGIRLGHYAGKAPELTRNIARSETAIAHSLAALRRPTRACTGTCTSRPYSVPSAPKRQRMQSRPCLQHARLPFQIIYPQKRQPLHTTNVPRRQEPSTQHRRESVIPQTFYDFFPETLAAGPPPATPFTIDTSKLRREFLKLQATAHPDHQQDSSLKSRAEALSARINEAYKTLADPLTRAQYLLSLRGIDVAEDETAKVDDQELLMEIMEAQEEIEEATQESDLVEIQARNEQKLEKCVAALEDDFARDDIEAAKLDCVRYKYFRNVREALREWTPGSEIRLVH